VRQLIGTLDRLIQGKEPLVQQTTVEPRLEEVPELQLAVIAERVAVDDTFTVVPEMIGRVAAWMTERGLECATPAVTLIRDPVHGIVNDSLEVAVGIEVPEGTTGDEVVSVRTSSAARAAVHDHRGRYQGLPAVYEPLRKWIVEQGLEPGEQTREIYLAHPKNTADAGDYLTRICWPAT
jgi:effector-binding domain-containing protein